MKNICVYDTRTNESSVTFRDTEMSVKVKRNLLPVYNFFTYPFQGCREASAYLSCHSLVLGCES